MNNQYKYLGQHLTARMSRELIQELFPGQTVQRQEIIRAVDEAHLERGGLPKRSIAHPVGSALSVMKADGLAERAEYGVWSILSETTDVNNQYQYSEQPLTSGIAQELIQELFEGQTAQKQEIITAVDEAHLERGGLASEDPVTTALSAMKISGLAENPESDFWSIISQTEERIRISTLDEFTKWAAQFDSGEGSEQYLFRGVSSADYKIDASAYRRIKKGRNSDERQEGDVEKFLQINRDLIENSRFRGHDQKDGRELKDLEVLAEFQHYGAATFLMDFTYNALVALWFACKKNSVNGPKDGKVVAVRPGDFMFTNEINLESLGDEIDELFPDNREKLYQWQPRHQNNRIIAQQSIFLFGVLEISPNSECLVDASSKEKIRDSLRRIYGITEDMLFPDFDGFARQYSQDVPYPQPTDFRYKERGSRAYQRREYEAAVSYFDMAIGQYSDDPEAYYQRGVAKFHLGRHESAISDYSEAIDRNSDYVEAYYQRGLAKFHLGEHESAISDYSEAIDRNSDYVEAYYQRGLAKFHLGRHESAISDYDEVHLNPYYALKQYLERYESAIDDYNSVIRINPNYAEAYYQRGLAKHHLDDYESAINDYDEAIRLGPDDAEIYYYRAEANFSLRQFTEGESDIQMALQLAKQTDDMDIIKRIEDLLYEINPETVGGSEDE